MIKSIRLNGNIVEYSLVRNSRSKRIRIVIKSDSSMKVSIPSSINFSFLENFIHEKSKWILDKIKSFKDKIRKISTKNSEKTQTKFFRATPTYCGVFSHLTRYSGWCIVFSSGVGVVIHFG